MGCAYSRQGEEYSLRAWPYCDKHHFTLRSKVFLKGCKITWVWSLGINAALVCGIMDKTCQNQHGQMMRTDACWAFLKSPCGVRQEVITPVWFRHVCNLLAPKYSRIYDLNPDVLLISHACNRFCVRSRWSKYLILIYLIPPVSATVFCLVYFRH